MNRFKINQYIKHTYRYINGRDQNVTEIRIGKIFKFEYTKSGEINVIHFENDQSKTGQFFFTDINLPNIEILEKDKFPEYYL